MTTFREALRRILPEDPADAVLVGRAWLPAANGPAVVTVREADLVDITPSFPTMRDLCETPDPAAAVRSAPGRSIGGLGPIVANTPAETRDLARPWLLAPIDL